MIKWYGRRDIGTGILHNMTDGGEGATGLRQTKESINKMLDTKKANGSQVGRPKGSSSWNKGKKTNIVPWNKGKKGVQVPWNKGIAGGCKGVPKGPMSQEHKDKLSAANKGKVSPKKGIPSGKPAWNKGKQSPIKGIPLTQEHRDKISATKKGLNNL